MTDQEWTAECTTDVLVSLTESLHIFTGLLTVSTVCGVFSGLLASSLLYVFCLKPMLLTRQGYNARRLFEPEDAEVDNNNQSDCVSNSKKEVQSGTINVKDKKQQLPINSDVAAFASRAKVVYPINQKYRPLADGASNPSLHEHAKLPSMPNDESCSSSSGESLSQEQDNDDSSQFISSSLLPKSLQNQSFTRVSHYPHTLTQIGFEGRISLYCLALQDIQQHCSQLQEEKCQIFLQIMKIIFSHRFPKDKNYADFSTNILQMQEKELDELKKKVSTAQNSSDGNEDQQADAPCTLEEIERAQKDQLEQSLQMTKGFSRQVEALCKHLLDRRTSVVPTEEAQEIIHSLTHTLLLMENHLSDTQEADLKRTQQRLLWWEQLMGLLQSQPALLKQEVSLRQALAARTLEQLTSDDHLTFVFMEKTLSELHAALTGAVQQCNEECIRKAKELVSDKCRKTESKRRKLQRSQVKEKSCVLGSTTHNNPQHFLKVYQELMLKHQQQSNDLELQQDDRVAEALCDLWRKLHSSWSKKLGELAKEVFLNALPAQSELPVERCEKLWLDLEEELLSQLQQSESTTSRQLEDMRVHLDHDGQVWCEETALVLSCLRHLGEQQMKILQAMVVRQSYSLNSQVGMLIEKKHEHMVVAVQRHFVTRHFCLKVLKEMRLSKLKMLSRADFRALLLEDHSKSQLTPSSSPKAQNKDSTASLAERHLGPESQLVGHSFQQEFLSELETGVELLQSHAQLLLGHTLSYAIWQLMAAKSQTVPQKDQGWKRHLTEVASESVYVTKGSLCALVQSYYSHMQDTTRKLQQDQSNISREEIERQESNNQLNKALLRELANWGRKPTSTEFQQRVEVHKRRVLEQYELEQEVVCEMLRRKKVTQDQAMDRVKEQLVEAEGAFMAELAALARVPLHCPEPEPSSQEDNNTGDESPNVLNLLALNPALDPALNPSLTPTIVTPAVKPMQKRKRERESQLK